MKLALLTSALLSAMPNSLEAVDSMAKPGSAIPRQVLKQISQEPSVDRLADSDADIEEEFRDLITFQRSIQANADIVGNEDLIDEILRALDDLEKRKTKRFYRPIVVCLITIGLILLGRRRLEKLIDGMSKAPELEDNPYRTNVDS